MAVALPAVDQRRLPAVLSAHAARLAAALRHQAPSSRTRSGAMAAYHMGWRDAQGRLVSGGDGGKLLRGGLCLWSGEAFGSGGDAAMPAALALEWVHNFTLVHDDIQDGDRERRHRPTLWTVVGEAQAINAGDALFAHAHRLLSAAGAQPARRLRALRILDDAVLEVIEGQCQDLALEGRPATSPQTYLGMARRKTGALFGAALACGAILGGCDAARARRLRGAGAELGLAFQVRDDWLGTFGDPALTGKPRGADLARRKVTHVVVSAYAAADARRRAQLRRLFASAHPQATAELRGLVDELDVASRCAATARRLAERAVDGLAEAGPEPCHLAEFADLASYAAERER